MQYWKTVFFVFVMCALGWGSTAYSATTTLDSLVQRVESALRASPEMTRLEYLQAVAIAKEREDISQWTKTYLATLYDRTMITFDGCGNVEDYKNQPWFSDLSTALVKAGIDPTYVYAGIKDLNYWNYSLGGWHEMYPQGDLESARMPFITHMCYSADGGMVVMNVPLMAVEGRNYTIPYAYDSKTVPYYNPIQIFRYIISTRVLEKATWSEALVMKSGESQDAHFVQGQWCDDTYTVHARCEDFLVDNGDGYCPLQNTQVIKGFMKRNGDFIELSPSGFADSTCRQKTVLKYYFVENYVDLESNCGACDYSGFTML